MLFAKIILSAFKFKVFPAHCSRHCCCMSLYFTVRRYIISRLQCTQ